MIGKIWGQRGLVPLIIFELIFDLSLYTFCLLWRPTPNSAWLVYPLFGLLGIYNSTAGMINTSKQLQKNNSKTLSKKSNLKQLCWEEKSLLHVYIQMMYPAFLALFVVLLAEYVIFSRIIQKLKNA